VFKIAEPKNFGVWLETCGETYLFGNKPVGMLPKKILKTITTYDYFFNIARFPGEENWQTCCSLGMEPLLINSVQELKCLSNLTQNGTWKGNSNYWTAGTQKDCRGSWSWCGKEGTIMLKDNITWDKDQPDNKGGREDCIHLKLKKNNTTGSAQEFVLTDRNCKDKYVLACKVLL